MKCVEGMLFVFICVEEFKNKGTWQVHELANTSRLQQTHIPTLKARALMTFTLAAVREFTIQHS
jgi:hypothetical protein